MPSRIGFVTFGMFIIDEIEYTGDTKKPQQDLIGGAGTYAALGARLAAAHQNAQAVSWIVDMGSDFPASFRQMIDSWDTSCVFRTDETRLTTRAWNGYGPNEHRAFKYLTPKIRLEVDSLTDDQAMAHSFHMVCSPSRCIDISSRLRRRREYFNEAATKPKIVWEPIPDMCTPEELRNLQVAARLVSVVSPNAEELAQFFDSESRLSQEDMVKTLMGWDMDSGARSTHVIVREGSEGSVLYFAPESTESGRCLSIRLPAYHNSAMSDQVVDPTGGGNTYLGALAMGLSDMMYNQDPGLDVGFSIRKLPEEYRRPIQAAVLAVIAASYAIEQCGVPLLIYGESDTKSSREELWNGQPFMLRLKVYLEREAEMIQEQISCLKHNSHVGSNGTL